MYTLIGTPAARPFRVLWALEELAQAYDIVPAKPQSKEALEYNPAGKVPILLDGNEPIIDSVAIIQYLADKHADLTYPAGTIKRAQQDSFTQFACDDIDGILWTMAKNTFVLPEEVRAPDVRKSCEYDFALSMTTLEKRLGDNDYVMGDRFTIPDLLIGHCASWARRAKFPLPQGRITNYIDRIHKRAAYKRSSDVRQTYAS